MKVGIVGLGYFSGFHIAAWQGLADADLIGGVDPSVERCAWAVEGFGLQTAATLDWVLAQNPDVMDIVAPPHAHFDLIKTCAAKGRVFVCQKPFCTSLKQAEAAVALADAAGARIVIHENFRFQPWHRTIKAFLDEGRMGQVYSAQFNLRPSDGRGANAYLARQPVFQTMQRLLIHETGLHFVDLFRWLFGEIESVYADIARLNSAIAGEDAGVLIMTHTGGVRSAFDGNRLSDHVTDKTRRTMDEMVIEGAGGALRLMGDGAVSFRAFGAQEWDVIPPIAQVDDAVFGGGCVAALICHVAEGVQTGEFENEAAGYLAVIRATEAAYQSAQTGTRIKV